MDRMDPIRLLYPQNSPGKNTGVGYHVLPQGIFPSQGNDCACCLNHGAVDLLYSPTAFLCALFTFCGSILSIEQPIKIFKILMGLFF